jgi:hypothetical protein
MLIALWILAAVLTLGAVAVGTLKLARSKSALKASGMDWTDDFSAPAVKGIGVLEIVGGAGVILPLATGILPILTPIAATCLVVLWIGAAVTHVRRREPFAAAAPSLVLAVLAAITAVIGYIAVLG